MTTNLIRQFTNFVNLVPIVNKPNKVTKSNRTLIDYIISNSLADQENLTGILKRDISDHFPIFTISTKYGLDSNYQKVTIKKRIINADSIHEFRDILYLISNTNDAYDYFLKVFSGIYDPAFPLKAFSVKKKKLAKSLDDQRLFKISKIIEKIELHEMKAFIKHINLFLKV